MAVATPSEAGKRKGGRPKVGATLVGVRLPPQQLAALDHWISLLPDPKPSRPEAIRRAVELAVKFDSVSRGLR